MTAKTGEMMEPNRLHRHRRILWHHDLPQEPVVLYSEIDDSGIEIRKVDEYRDGRLDFADSSRSTGTTVLSEKTVPSLDAILAQDQFSGGPITKEEFEEVWLKATESRPSGQLLRAH